MTHLSHPKYRPDIDGLRAIAVLSVVGFHAFPSKVQGGFVGVDIFFVVSGYLISTIIIENLNRGTFSFAEFYARRVRRIFPALLIVLSACFTFGWFALFADEYMQLGKHIAAGAGFVSNLVLWSEKGYFDNAAETKPLLHLWSLGIEEQYYIVWPLLVWLAWKRKVGLLVISIAILVASFALNVYTIQKDAVATFYSPLTRVWELMCGGILAWYVVEKKETTGKLTASQSNLISAVGIALLGAGIFLTSKESNFPGWWALLPGLGTVLVIIAGTKAWINRSILSNGIAVWFGLISFPLYLWHWPLLSFARIIESVTPDRITRIAAVLTAIFLAWLTYMLIERPVRFSSSSKKRTPVLIGLMTFMGCVGYSLYRLDGLPTRDSIKQHGKNNSYELILTPARDEECLKYIKSAKPPFPFCKFTNVNSSTTVAVIGDSHALVAYPGIAELLGRMGTNTVALANSGCPPLLGGEYGANETEKLICKHKIETLLETVRNSDDIRKVFVFTRGPYYLAGGEMHNKKTVTPFIEMEVFRESLQASIDSLKNAGKEVYYVTENPELPVHPFQCISRPFRTAIQRCEVKLKDVIARQKQYLDIASRLHEVTLINPLNGFCDDDTCYGLRDGVLLYSDDDHLSVAGSRFQAEKVLKSYLVHSSN